MFPLLRYFSIASLLSVIATTLLLGWLHHQVEREQLLTIGESNHVGLTQSFANALLPQFRKLADAAPVNDVSTLAQRPEFIALREGTLAAMRNTAVVKVKAYDRNGITLFSTDPTQIGKDYSANAGFLAAMKGKPVSELTHRDRFSAFDREIVNRDVLSTYVALRVGGDGPIEGVLEVYSDVTHWVAETNRQARVITLAVVASLCVLYAVLYIIVRRANGILREQYRQRQLAEAELRIAATAFESQEGMAVADRAGTILRVNQAFVDITGHDGESLIGHTMALLHSDRHNEDFYDGLWIEATARGGWQGEIWCRRQDGSEFPAGLTVTAVAGVDGEVGHYVLSLIDITERKAAEEEIRFLAFFDTLTGLPNRRLLQDRLHRALRGSARSGEWGALLFVDLDHFKEVNDRYGHDKGDLLLQQVALRLRSSVREIDTVARWGGDEFILVLESLGHARDGALEHARHVADKVLAAFAAPFDLDGQSCRNSPSVGLTVFSGQDASVEALLKQADAAMYRAKTAGRNAVHVFDAATAD